MNVDPRALALVKSFEGCQLKAYCDPGTHGEPWSIGYGQTGPDVHLGLVWSQTEADARLAAHLAATQAGVDRLVGAHLTTTAQAAAMTCLAYNIGLGALAGSTLLRMHNAGDHDGAALQFARWNRAGGRPMPGLTRRRAAERALYVS
ncbi:MAG: lysozyme [Janthinobacterium lividum]